MDLMSDMLRTLNFHSSVYFRTELSAPFGLDVPENGKVVRFHVVVDGHCVVSVPGAAWIELAKGDVVLVPHGLSHRLADHCSTGAVDLSRALSQASYEGSGPFVHGGGGPRTTLICGHFGFNRDLYHPFLAHLPPVIHVPARPSHGLGWTTEMTTSLGSEADSQLPGAAAILDRLSEIMFIQVLRAYLRQPDSEPRLLAAFTDPCLSKVLCAIHAEPGRNWTLDALAGVAHQSRSTFVERFRDSMRMSPMDYLTHWRMQVACQRLTRSADTLTAIAEAAGYSSEGAFSRTFLRHVGMRPGAYRVGARGTLRAPGDERA